MQYVTVFDVGREGFAAWWATAVGAALVGCGVAALLYLRLRVGPKVRVQKMFVAVWTGAAAVWTIVAYSGTHAEFARLRNALVARQFAVVEGVVTHFKPAPTEGHADEQFDVGEHHYSFSDFVMTAGYHRSRSHGGAIREGLRVRIADVGGEIARLDTVATISMPLPNER